MPPLSFLGSAAPSHAPVDKVVVITDKTRYVNVTSGSTVQFVAGDHVFTWNFQNGAVHIWPFDLGLIAPKGFLSHPVKAYVADNPLFQG